MTLGKMQFILGSSKEPALRAFAQRVFPVGKERLFGQDEVAARLNHEQRRNKAAHDKGLMREDAPRARVCAVGVLGNL